MLDLNKIDKKSTRERKIKCEPFVNANTLRSTTN